MRYLIILPALLLFAAPAAAQEGCVVDFNTLKVRPVAEQDTAMTLPEQSLLKYGWANDATIPIGKLTYAKGGSPVVMVASDLIFYNFKDSVPFVRAATDASEKPALYALIDGAKCELQPYTPAP